MKAKHEEEMVTMRLKVDEADKATKSAEELKQTLHTEMARVSSSSSSSSSNSSSGGGGDGDG